MSDEQDRALLMDIAERQKAIQVEVANLIAGHTQALEQYATSDMAYRKLLDEYQVQLENYRKDQEALVASRHLAMLIRLIALLLLLFIAYRLY